MLKLKGWKLGSNWRAMRNQTVPRHVKFKLVKNYQNHY
jgi:hypothetical protein